MTQYLRSMQVVDYSKRGLRAVAPALIELSHAEGSTRTEWQRKVPLRVSSCLRFLRRSIVAGHRTSWRGFSSASNLRVWSRTEPMIDVPIRLNVNENPFPPSPEVIESIARAVADAASNLNRYADRDAVELQGLAAYVSAESGVAVTAGQVWAS